MLSQAAVALERFFGVVDQAHRARRMMLRKASSDGSDVRLARPLNAEPSRYVLILACLLFNYRRPRRDGIDVASTRASTAWPSQDETVPQHGPCDRGVRRPCRHRSAPS